MAFTVTEWVADDVAALLTYVQRYHTNARIDLLVDWQTQLQTAYDNRATNGSIWLKAESGDQEFAGLLVFGKNTESPLTDDGNRLDLWFYYFRPKFKGQGVAKDLSDELITRATAAGITKVCGVKARRTVTTKMTGLTRHLQWRQRGNLMVRTIEQA